MKRIIILSAVTLMAVSLSLAAGYKVGDKVLTRCALEEFEGTIIECDPFFELEYKVELRVNGEYKDSNIYCKESGPVLKKGLWCADYYIIKKLKLNER